ncbi:MAG: DUF4349 domain-containing protein [Actinobacteria bacterium]|nr:MAG: DUF4349 domain-containing protein [Actinomycetota bacterium]
MSARSMVAVIGLVVVAGLTGAACGGGGAMKGTAAVPRAAPAEPGGGLDLGPIAGPTLAPQPADIAGGGTFQLPTLGPRIIKTASVTLDVKDGTFEQRAQDVTLVASRHGGFVSSSRTSGSKFLSGTFVLRIPATQFEVALGELKALGKVKGEQISGEDVTAQFVDLQARLRNWEAQESVLLKLMAKSTSIEESLKVQRALQDVQLAIEEIRGQLRVLTDQTDMSTITLSMSEAVPVPGHTRANAFVRAWRAAVHGTVAVVTAVVVGFGYLVPVLVIAILAALGLWVFRRAKSRPGALPAP